MDWDRLADPEALPLALPEDDALVESDLLPEDDPLADPLKDPDIDWDREADPDADPEADPLVTAALSDGDALLLADADLLALNDPDCD
jgi:hypothetical protein